MAENVLISYVNGEISLEEIENRLNSPNEPVRIEGFCCEFEEFVSYFLNFIHEEITVGNNENSVVINEMKPNKKSHPSNYDEMFEFENLKSSTPKPNKNKTDLNLTWPRKSSDANKSQRSLNFQRDHNLRFGDFLANKKPSGVKANKRRIKPTFIERKITEAGETPKEKNIQDKENSLENINFEGVSCKNVQEGRTKILEDLVKIQRNNLNLDATCLSFNNITKIEISPNFENCTNLPELSLLVNLYIYLFKNNFILNTLSELYFLISILTSKQFQDDPITVLELKSNKLKSLVKSIHNQVYFSLEILTGLTNYLKILDRSTLNLLLNNKNVQNFAKEKYSNFKNNLNLLISEKQNEKISINPNWNVMDVRNVNFTIENDNRDNFISDNSFHAFRKQRDAFYEILKIWEDKHKNPDWNFPASLSYKIKTLLNLSEDPINFRQLAKLFKSQLLLVCHKENEDGLRMQNEEAILQHFPGVDSSKLNKLKQRVLSKSENVGLESPPVFIGYQEFFRDFIICCSSHSFLEHLKEVFLVEILTDDDYKFTGYDLGDRENNLKSQAVQRVLEKLDKLSVFAKYLGFLESLPFRNDFGKMSKKIVQNQIDSRQFYRGVFNVEEVLLNAIEKNRIVFTTCWVTIYLSMLDYITLRLPNFQKAISILFDIYKGCRHFDFSSSSYTKLLLRTSLSWFFGLAHFPNEFYNRSLFKKSSIINEDNFKDISERYFLEIINGINKEYFPIDKLDLIRENALYIFYPSLETFKNLLSSTTSRNRLITRHITPLARTESKKTKQQIQKQLEEAFLNSQSNTVRKIIEFSTEKIASGCIQHLSTQLSQIKRKIINIETSQTSNIMLEIKSSCLEISDRIIWEKTDLAIKGLMSKDELPATVKKCIDISRRICQEKIKLWLEVTVTKQSIEKAQMQESKKLAMSKSQLKATSNMPPGGKNVPHSESSLSAVKILENLKNLMIRIIEDQDLTEEEVKSTLNDCKDTIETRCDVNDNIMLTVHKLTVDLYFVLVCFMPDLAEISLESFCTYWTHFKVTKELFKQIVSIRNIHMLSISKDKKKSWNVFTELLVRMNRIELVNIEDLEQQCLGVFKQNWDEETLSDICKCYQRLIEKLKHRNESFSQLLPFISSYCLDLNSF